MNLPWVSRARFEALKRIAAGRLEEMRQAEGRVLASETRRDDAVRDAGRLERRLADALKSAVDVAHAAESAQRDAERWKDGWTGSQAREEAGRVQLHEERARGDAILARYAEVVERMADLLDKTLHPPVAAVAAPVPDFQSFPPVVAGALALANAGFKPDEQRATYKWAAAQLAIGTEPKEVARMLQEGRPVDIDVATAD